MMDDARPLPKIHNGFLSGASYKRARRMLVATFPKTFVPRGQPKRPLSFAVKRRLIEASEAGGIDLTREEVCAFMAAYCSSRRYLASIVPGAARVGLDGLAHGLVDETAARLAREKMARKGWLP